MNSGTTKRRQLPKLYACATKLSLENLRNKALFGLDLLDAKGIRRIKVPLHECIILELRESGYAESSSYLQDLIYDNVQLLEEDELGIVVDLRKRPDYLNHIYPILQRAEREHDKGDSKKETLHLLGLALFFADREKGILWLAEKLFLAAIAVASQYLIDGGRQKACCKYRYAKFLLDKFPAIDEEPFNILTEVRDTSIGKDWLLHEDTEPDINPKETVFRVTAIQLHRVLINNARKYRPTDAAKAERLSRLAERRAKDAEDTDKEAEAIIEIGICQLVMNNLNSAQKTFERALQIHQKSNNIEGLCETKMHLAAVMQRLGAHEIAAKLLTEMGMLAMDNGLRRQLGRALHLLGELHLRREKPELGTQHLTEAFMCFMGFGFNVIKSELEAPQAEGPEKNSKMLSAICSPETSEIFEEEAEQSRLMAAISAGQELMASYFNLLRESRTCAIAKMKTIEWKLDKRGWWNFRRDHNYLPCPCPAHNRTPLDVLRIKQQEEKEATIVSTLDMHDDVGRMVSAQDIMKLRSSYLAGFT
ncbi:unnamed protein product [Arctia plantaginis]|uniref:Tetratricopeptide repeat protein 29 n=1 Tax=Arctia plantaginis TaxID=874455 RepID=A0A8S0Z765_ARCPL|nr:unnamed protein product [Arctia plantaginis]